MHDEPCIAAAKKNRGPPARDRLARRMALARRLTLQLCAALAVPAVGAAYTGTRLFPLDPEHRASLAIIGPAVLAVLALSALAFWRLLAPVRAGLEPGSTPDQRRSAAAAALRLPSQISSAVLFISLLGIGAVLAQRLAVGRPLDIALAAAGAAAAFAIMASMLAYSVASAGLSPALVGLGHGGTDFDTHVEQRLNRRVAG